MFIKVNMEGIPIGRKVNLRAYNSYDQLSLAIDDLFSGLLEGLSTKPDNTKCFTTGNFLFP